MDISQLTSQFQTADELRIFAASQFKQILTLSKKVKELEDNAAILRRESRELLKKESNSSPILLEAGNIKGQEDAKLIAQVQLKLLKDKAFDGELSLEEAKRVELFNKILIDPTKEEEKPLKANARIINTEDLMKLVGDGK